MQVVENTRLQKTVVEIMGKTSMETTLVEQRKNKNVIKQTRTFNTLSGTRNCYISHVSQGDNLIRSERQDKPILH